MKYKQYMESRLFGEEGNRHSRYFTKDNAPQDLSDLIHDIHNELGQGLPTDWVYEQVYDAIYSYEKDGVTDFDDLSIESDIYNLFDWARDFVDMIDEASQELGRGEDIHSEIAQANWYCKDRIYRLVYEFLDKAEDEEEES